jgi:hypothetical protein
MIKINRSDLLSALYAQFNALPGGERKQLELAEHIQPVVDISRPSKIPYADYFNSSYSGVASGTVKTGKVGFRYVVTSWILSYRMIATDTGTYVSLAGTVKGSPGFLGLLQPVPSVASSDTISGFGEWVMDENTDITVTATGSFTSIYGIVSGYKIRNPPGT